MNIEVIDKKELEDFLDSRKGKYARTLSRMKDGEVLKFTLDSKEEYLNAQVAIHNWCKRHCDYKSFSSATEKTVYVKKGE